MARVHGVFGVQDTETFLVNITLPQRVVFTGVRVTKGQIGGADILIGMDIIMLGDFSVTNTNGSTKFSYRTPSIEHIDYHAQVQAINAARKLPINRAERRRAKSDRP